MKPKNHFTLKIYINGNSFLFNKTEEEIKTFKNSLGRNIWLKFESQIGTELNIHTSEVKCYEVIKGSIARNTKKGEMTLIRLAELMGVHPVTVSKLASSGKIPVISSQGARRKHSRATVDTALALREKLSQSGRDVPTIQKIKEAFT